MNQSRRFDIIATGLAIFSMLFGAGNLMFPIKAGIISGEYNFFGISGFIITAVILPLAGLIAMILYDGDYMSFFYRMGKIPGKIMVFISMLVIGPIIGLPRCVSVAQVMISPFLPIAALQGSGYLAMFLFSVLFLGLTFLASYKENNIVDILGYFISPLLLISLATVIIKGLVFKGAAIVATATPLQLFKTNILKGYETLDLLGTIFFASIVITILKNKMGKQTKGCLKKLAAIGLKAGILGVTLLGIIYVGMSYLGAFHGHGLASLNDGQAFREVVFRVIGTYGTSIISTATLMACLSTSIALSAVATEYVEKNIFRGKIGYITALILVLLASIPLSTYGLNAVLAITGGPLVFIGYPALIVLTFCNIAYKLFGFKYVKAPVFATLLISFSTYYIF